MLRNWIGGRGRITAGVICALACEVIFGFSFFFTKVVVQRHSTLALLAWRFVIAWAVLTLAWACGLVRIAIPRKSRLPLLGLGLLFPGGYFLCEAAGVKLTTSSEVGVLIAGIPAISLLLGMLIKHERPYRKQVYGILLTGCGVAVCAAARGLELSGDFTGYLLILAAIGFYCGFVVLAELVPCSTLSRTYGIITVAAVGYAAGALAEAIPAGRTPELLTLPLHHADFLVPIFYLGVICSCLSLVLCNCAISILGSTRFAAFIGVETLTAILAGVLLLREQLTATQLAGAVLVIVGIGFANTPPAGGPL